MNNLEAVQPVLDYIQNITGAGSVLLAISASLYGLVKIFKLQLIQSFLSKLGVPGRYLWAKWPLWVKWLVVAVSGFAAGVLTGVAGGAGVGPAVAAGLVTMLAAMGVDRTEKVAVQTYKDRKGATDKESLKVPIVSPDER